MIDCPDRLCRAFVNGSDGNLGGILILGRIKRFAEVEFRLVICRFLQIRIYFFLFLQLQFFQFQVFFMQNLLHCRSDDTILRQCLDIAANHVKTLLVRHFLHRLCRKLSVNDISILFEVGMRHISISGDSQQNDHHGGKTGSPCSKQTAHFLFMRIGGSGIVSLCSAPRHTVEYGTENTDKYIKQIESTHIFNIIGIQHTFTRSTVHQRRNHFPVPRKTVEDIGNNDRIQRVRDKSLHTVCHHNRNLPAHGHDPYGNTEKQQHQKPESGEFPVPDIKMNGKIQEIHHAACSDCGENRIVDHAGDRLENCRKNTECPVVADFEELPHRHRLGFTEAIVAETGQSEDQSQRSRNSAPETDCESAGIIHLPHRHQ